MIYILKKINLINNIEMKEKRKKFISEHKGISKFGSSECADVMSEYDRSIKKNKKRRETLRHSVYNSPLIDHHVQNQLAQIIEMDGENETNEQNQ